MSAVPDRRLADVLRETLRYARVREYTGWDYGDGLSSRWLRALPIDSRVVNLAVQETIKRAPVNVRPLFRVEQRRNYKGTALFVLANLNAHRLGSEVVPAPDVRYADEAMALADWLVENRSVGYSGFCGGHNHEIQHLHTKGVPNDPDVVSTSYAVRALLAAATHDPGAGYADVARTAESFVVEDLDYREHEDGAVINYHMNHPADSRTLNAAALGARLLVDLHDRFGDDALLDRATRILDYVAARQTDLGGWTYRDPPDASHLSMDNHHNGFVVECFLRYGELTGSDRYADTVERALAFYRERLFDDDGAPNWDESSAYPRDVHAAAQGILTFTYAGDPAFARRIAGWTLDNLYAGDGRFYYRKHRFYTKRITLMRWCQAWMAYAVSEFLRAER